MLEAATHRLPEGDPASTLARVALKVLAKFRTPAWRARAFYVLHVCSPGR